MVTKYVFYANVFPKFMVRDDTLLMYKMEIIDGGCIIINTKFADIKSY